MSLPISLDSYQNKMWRTKITWDYRVCKTCWIEKHISEYSFRNIEKQQYNCHCKECIHKKWRERDRLKYQEDEEFRKKRVENTRRYRKEHPDRCRKTNLKCRYWLTEEWVNEMRKAQWYKCAICWEEEKNLKRWLLVDHDHNTWKVRWLLCDTCNKFLWFYEKYSKECKDYLNK